MRNWLVNIRKQAGYKKQTSVANVIGISQQYYNFIEKGTRRPSPEVAQRIAEALSFDKYGYDWTKFYEEEKNEVAG